MKTAFASLLYDDLFYVMESEANADRRYTDLVMTVRSSMRQYALLDVVMEFKYLGLSELGLNAEQLSQSSPNELAALPAVQTALNKALQQLTHYQQALIQRYQEPQRLHCFAIVALGFERVVWRVL